MNDIIIEFIEYLGAVKNYSPHTAAAYQTDVQDFVEFLGEFNGGDVTIESLGRADTICFRSYMANRQRRGLAAKSTARALSSLRGFYKFIGRKYEIKNDAIELISAPKIPRKLSKAIDAGDVENMHDAIRETNNTNPWIASRDWALVMLLFGCGLRISEALALTIQDVTGRPDILHIYGKGKKAVIMITSNKGLAGGYNSNIIKLITKNEEFTRDNTVIYAIGKKGKDSMKRYGYTIGKDYSEVIEEPAYQDAVAITKELLAAFEAGEISEIYLAYTFFRNTVSHIPTLRKLLPVDVKDAGVKEEEGATAPMNFEPEDEEALTLIIPKYIASQLYGGLIESIASENGARMQAMDSATNNATEMIDHLSLLYNRARQSSITQELTEIIAGADAIN